VTVLPQLATQLEPAAIVLLGLGGVAYTVGAVIYARRRPNTVPTVFAYHELFHAYDHRSCANTSRSPPRDPYCMKVALCRVLAAPTTWNVFPGSLIASTVHHQRERRPFSD
jgi:hypothetical protein